MSNTYESPELMLIQLCCESVIASSYDSGGMNLPTIPDGPSF